MVCPCILARPHSSSHRSVAALTLERRSPDRAAATPLPIRRDPLRPGPPDRGRGVLHLARTPCCPRKSYLGFDLAGIEPERIADAELMLHFAPTGWGLASLVPDATFSVYGLLADKAWDEQSLGLANAPANTGKNPAGLVNNEVRKLGSFLIEQGVQRGQFGIGGESLAAFLRERAGSAITLIVVRDIGEFETNGLVHGFASRRHPILPAPTLAIRY